MHTRSVCLLQFGVPPQPHVVSGRICETSAMVSEQRSLVIAMADRLGRPAVSPKGRWVCLPSGWYVTWHSSIIGWCSWEYSYDRVVLVQMHMGSVVPFRPVC